MVKSLLNLLKKPKKGSELLTELDISRVVTETNPAPTARPTAIEDRAPGIDLDGWKQNDLDLLSSTWQATCDNPEDDGAANEFRTALHNLHGASGAYGGGALTRLSGSLHELVSGIKDLHSEAALINLHVQACRATAHSDSDEMADAVCDALEGRVEYRLHGTLS
ncbi:MAG: hypothetical protein AAGL11_03020 [Pseudomonadota bacterium]